MTTPPTIPARALRKLKHLVESMRPTAGRIALGTASLLLPREQVLAGALIGLPVESLIVRGEQGVFEGSPTDVSVILRYALERQWTPRTMERVVKFFGPSQSGTYVDVGANIGLTAIPIAARGIDVLAFEPVPQNYGFLLRNAERNDAGRHMTIENVALLDREDTVLFELSPSNHGDHRYRGGDGIAFLGEQNWETVRVRAQPLDSYFERMRAPIALKIDTQGSEPLVVSGGRKVWDAASLVICEFSPYAMARMGVDPRPLIDNVARFERLDIFEREDETPIFSGTGIAAAKLLAAYHAANTREATGRYLNLIGERR